MSDLMSELERASRPRDVRNVAELIERMKPALVKSLQNEALADMLMRHYLTSIRLNPVLQECSPESLLAALLLSAQVRLEPGPLGHVYLVPYKRECVWILGYTGIMELARRSDRVAGLRATVIHEHDEYQAPWENEKGIHYHYRPAVVDERGDRIGVLVTWRERMGASWLPLARHVGPDRIDRAREASAAARKQEGPWMTDPEAMWAKTGIRACRPWLPLMPDAGLAMRADEHVISRIEIDEDGTAQPVIEPSGDEE
jgi:recombination protein RecT